MPLTALQAILIALTAVHVPPGHRIISETPDDDACTSLGKGGSISGQTPKGTWVKFQCVAGKGFKIEYEPDEPEQVEDEELDEPRKLSRNEEAQIKYEKEAKMRTERLREKHRMQQERYNIFQQREKEDMLRRAQRAQEMQEQKLR